MDESPTNHCTSYNPQSTVENGQATRQTDQHVMGMPGKFVVVLSTACQLLAIALTTTILIIVFRVTITNERHIFKANISLSDWSIGASHLSEPNTTARLMQVSLIDGDLQQLGMPFPTPGSLEEFGAETITNYTTSLEAEYHTQSQANKFMKILLISHFVFLPIWLLTVVPLVLSLKYKRLDMIAVNMVCVAYNMAMCIAEIVVFLIRALTMDNSHGGYDDKNFRYERAVFFIAVFVLIGILVLCYGSGYLNLRWEAFVREKFGPKSICWDCCGVGGRNNNNNHNGVGARGGQRSNEGEDFEQYRMSDRVTVSQQTRNAHQISMADADKHRQQDGGPITDFSTF